MSTLGTLAYRKTSAQTGVENADPHRLIQMLLDGAIEKINHAKFFMSQDKVAEKGEQISWAISIIGGLQTSLNRQQGGELADNLNRLYEYCGYTLLQANVANSTEQLNDVLGVLQNIKEGWDGIRDQAIQLNSQTKTE